MTTKWYMPQYYGSFICKKNECRSTCCSRWKIPITEEEYFRLITMDCSPELNQRISNAFDNPGTADPQRYRLISFNWQGYCRLLENGLCSLYLEKGENYLPAVCRLYPRSLKNVNGISLACCSSSCERVVEMLYEGGGLNIVAGNLDEQARLVYHISEEDELMLKKVNEIMMQPDKPFTGRLAEACRLVNREQFDRDFTSKADPVLLAVDLLEKLRIDNELLAEACEKAAIRYKLDPERYRSDDESLQQRFAGYPGLLEKVINNSLLYQLYPFADERVDRTDAYRGLCCCYGLLKVISAGYMSDHDTLEDLVDIIAAVFHLIEHTAFYYNTANLCAEAAVMLKL